MIELDSLVLIAYDAGRAIMRFYSDSIKVINKADDSPLTMADLSSHEIIDTALQKLTPNIPIVSEESENVALAISNYADDECNKIPSIFWLVDPLDGTKEFINKNGEFTVNIALVKNQQPILGIVYAPALNIMYVGDVERNIAYKIDKEGAQEKLRVNKHTKEGIIVVGSRSHNDEAQMQQFLSGYQVKKFIGCGSSLKFCLIAEGKAHLYPRLGRTMEWDTAAAHAVLKAAGGKVETTDGNFLLYGKPGLDNPHFIASAS